MQGVAKLSGKIACAIWTGVDGTLIQSAVEVVTMAHEVPFLFLVFCWFPFKRTRKLGGFLGFRSKHHERGGYPQRTHPCGSLVSLTPGSSAAGGEVRPLPGQGLLFLPRAGGPGRPGRGSILGAVCWRNFRWKF